MKRKTKTIFHIILPCLLILILVLAFFAFQRDLKQHLQNNAYRSLSEIAMEHKYYFNCRLEGEINVLKTLAISLSEEETRDDRKVFAKMNRLAEITGFQYFSIIEKDGTRTSNHGYRDNISNFEFFGEISKGKPVISEPMTSLVDGRKKEVIFMSYPVRKNGSVEYSLMGAYEVEDMVAILFSESLGGESYSTIINTNGDTILIDNHKNRLSNDSNIFDFYKTVTFREPYSLTKLQEQLKAGKQGTFSYEFEGNHRLGYYQPSDVNGWMILSVMPEIVVDDSTDSISVIVNRLIFCVTGVFVILMIWIFVITKAESLRFKEKAEIDGMTGILNKATTEKRMKSALLKADGNCHALFILDIDNFKGINDTMGHSIGDEVITRVAAVLKDAFRQEDIIGRIGGDEFAVLYQNVEESDLHRKANEMVAAFKTMEIHFNMPVSCSIGIAVSDGQQYHFARLYEEADQALYQAKRHGKSQYAIYEKKE